MYDMTTETTFPGTIAKGAKGWGAKRAQEWLTLHGQGVAIDGDFGRISAHATSAFQETAGLPVTGVVDEATWAELVQPMRDALTPLQPMEGETLGQLFVCLLERFLAAHVREVGGDNMGPWVRLFMRGLEGAKESWCAGFVTTVFDMACQMLGVANPIGYAVNCTHLSDLGQKAGMFMQGEAVPDGAIGIGLVEKAERSDNDERYSHTYGFYGVADGIAASIEGNFGSGVKAGVYSYHRDMRRNDALVIP